MIFKGHSKSLTFDDSMIIQCIHFTPASVAQPPSAESISSQGTVCTTAEELIQANPAPQFSLPGSTRRKSKTELPLQSAGLVKPLPAPWRWPPTTRLPGCAVPRSVWRLPPAHPCTTWNSASHSLGRRAGRAGPRRRAKAAAGSRGSALRCLAARRSPRGSVSVGRAGGGRARCVHFARCSGRGAALRAPGPPPPPRAPPLPERSPPLPSPGLTPSPGCPGRVAAPLPPPGCRRGGPFLALLERVFPRNCLGLRLPSARDGEGQGRVGKPSLCDLVPS